jgi:hypothetical protein
MDELVRVEGADESVSYLALVGKVERQRSEHSQFV